MATNNDLTLKVGFDIDKFQAELSKTSASLDKWSSGIQNSLKGLVAGFGILKVGSDVISVTSQFQKFSAVLTNTLGSDSQAQRALKDIRDFALQTPFEVSEVTAAYVRWANQGLDPTIDRMRKLGDVASSLGAGFEQTAEAFKDLAVGQTKRIEEIGISAQQAGGKIQLSFKGVNIEVDKNAQGVQKALDVYSQLNGVLGTSDAVAKTLGGRISNLKDAYDNLMLTIGTGTSGVLFGAIESMTKLANATANFKQELSLIRQAISPFRDLSNVSKETLDYLIKFGRTDTGKQVADVLKPIFDQDNVTFFKDINKNLRTFIQSLIDEGESVNDATTLWKYYLDTRIASNNEDVKAAKDDRLKAVLDEKALAVLRYAKALEIANARQKALGLDQTIKHPLDNTKSLDIKTPTEKIGIGSFAMGDTLMNPLIESQKRVKEATEKSNEAFLKQREIMLQNAVEVSNVASAIGDGIGQVMTGQENLRQAVSKSVIAIIDLLEKRALAAIIANAALTGGNPIAAIALATAGFAAIKALFAKIGSNSGGGGGSSMSGTQNRAADSYQKKELQVSFNGGFTVKGNDLAVVLEKRNYKVNRVG